MRLAWFALVLLARIGAAAWLPQPQFRPARAAARACVCASVAQDELIGELRKAPADQLANVLASNFKQVDASLFLRLAEMADEADDDSERDDIATLSTRIASTVEQLLAQAGSKLDADAEVVQELMRLAANEQGEFTVPVPAANIAKVRAEVQSKLGQIDDGFVGTLEAYMKKASDDGLEGLVEVLRELLQVYATERMVKMLEVATPAEVVQVVRKTLEAPPADWEAQLRAQMQADDAAASPDMVLGALQDKMGEVVLGMPSGSKVQGVLAEMLNELISRTRTIEAEMAA